MDMNYWVFVDAVIPDVTASLLLIELLCGIYVFQLLKANNSLLTGGKISSYLHELGLSLMIAVKKQSKDQTMASLKVFIGSCLNANP